MTAAPPPMTTRRRLLGTAVAIVGVAALGGLGALASRARVVSSTWLRPPGALPPGAFEEACIRCFRCAEVCPPACIRFDSLLPPLEADTPFIDASEKACTLCMLCTEACPTGALVKIAAADVRMGIPVLAKERCIAHRGGPCRLCSGVCPYQGKAVTLDDRLAPVFFASHCTGCGLCEEACPVEPRAITIRPPGAA